MNRRSHGQTWITAWALLTVTAWICLGANAARGAEEKQLPEGRLSMGLGAGLVRFDTNFKFAEKETGRSVFVDAEGTLGLPESDTVGWPSASSTSTPRSRSTMMM